VSAQGEVMACCAIAPGCGRVNCYLCTVVALLPQPLSLLDRQKQDDTNATRDGDPKLAGERKRNPIFTKRNRLGPNYVPHERRV